MLMPRFKRACIEASRSPKYHIEVAQMARQRTGRVSGSCEFMSVLGIVEKSVKNGQAGTRGTSGNADGEADAESLGTGVEAELLQLGNASKYKLLENDSGKLEQFVKDSLTCEMQWQQALASDNFEYVASTIATIVEKSRIAQSCMNPAPKTKDNYVDGLVRLKLFLVCWLFGGLRGLDWKNVNKRRMLDLMPDVTQQLGNFPDDWTATEISCFLFGRLDRFPFATMWPCLFHECVDAKHQKEALHLIESGAYVAKARALRESLGVEHHPINIFNHFFGEASIGD